MAIDLKKLNSCLKTDVHKLYNLGQYSSVVRNGVTTNSVFIDNSASVLAICVIPYSPSVTDAVTESETLVGPLDDRLNLYLLKDYISQFVDCDLLITNTQQGVKSFVPPRQYNWSFDFSRELRGATIYEFDDTPDFSEEAEYFMSVDTIRPAEGTVREHLGCCHLKMGFDLDFSSSRFEWTADIPLMEATMASFFAFWLVNQDNRYVTDLSLLDSEPTVLVQEAPRYDPVSDGDLEMVTEATAEDQSLFN